MSYDIRLGVKVEGLDQIVEIGEPELSSPTYNLGTMFRACTGWNYKQGEYYRCSDVIDKIEHGIRELRTRPSAYKVLEPSNGWGSLDGALRVLESMRDCIYERAEDIPIEHLWIAW